MQDVAVFVFESGDDLRDGGEGIGRSAAVHAGVEVGLGAADFEFGVDHAAQADAEGGQAGGEEFGVGDEREVGLEIGGLGGDVVGNSLPSHFFFAFEEDADIERERFVGGEQGFEGFDLHPDLAFVVDGAAGVDIAVAFGGLEGRRESIRRWDRWAGRRSGRR